MESNCNNDNHFSQKGVTVIKPNILLIMCDTVRCDALSCMGGIEGTTPNLDKMAKNGVMFTQSYSASPVCSPARCSLLTGVYPQVHMVTENGIPRLKDLPVFPDLLKQQGYYNIMVGKTHFDPVPDSFDVQLLLKGEKAQENDDFYGVFAHENGYARASKPPFDKPEKFCADAYVAQKTIDEIEIASKNDKPFFAFCSMLSPHGPIDTPLNYVDKLDGAELPALNYVENEEKALHPRIKILLGLEEKDFEGYYESQGYIYETDRQKYYELMNFCDAQIGKIIDYLYDSNLAENTLVLFTSDHGQQNGDHGFNDKHNFYDETWRVPLIMQMPGRIPKGLIRKFANTVDVTASILAVAGTSCDTMSGFDLLTPLIQGKENPRTCAVATLFGYTAIVTDDYKLEYYFSDGTGRMFDRKFDFKEQNNIFYDNKYIIEKNILLEALLSWYSGTINLYYYKKNSKGGGPVAIRVKNVLSTMTALQNEILCQNKISSFWIVNKKEEYYS